jgi:hypothetical protein
MSPRFIFPVGALLGEIYTFTASLQLFRRRRHYSGGFFFPFLFFFFHKSL